MNLDGIRVLLVEDNPGDVRLAQEAFRHSSSPVTLHIVSDGDDAMSFLRREGVHVHAPRPHLILLDLICANRERNQPCRNLFGS